MAYCPRCGTANPAGAEKCPLCTTTLPLFDDESPSPPSWPDSSNDHTAKVWLSDTERRRRALLTLSFVLWFPAVLVTGVDLLLAGRITWSWIPDLSLLGLWFLVLGGFSWRRQPQVLLAFTAVLAALIVLLANFFSVGRLDWSLTAGLPLVGWTWALVSALLLWLARSPHPGWNLFGHLCWGTAVLCGGIEATLSWAHLATPAVSWSGIVALVLVPLGLLFEVLHYALGRRLNLRQSFHF